MPSKFDVSGALKAGYSAQEIADQISKDESFDISGARKAGYTSEEIIKYFTGVEVPSGPDSNVEGTDGVLEKADTRFGKAAEALSAPNYAMAQGASALIKGEPVLPAMKKGFFLEEPKVFGDVLSENDPYAWLNPTGSAILLPLTPLHGSEALAERY
jgi:hypothetical protein